MSQISEVIVHWTPNTSGRAREIQIQSRIKGLSEWSAQGERVDPALGSLRFTSNAPSTQIEVRCRIINNNGIPGDWFTAEVTTAPAVVEYEDVDGKPTRLEQINESEGTKLGGIAPGADVTSANTSKDTAAVNGVPSATITAQLSSLLEGGFADSTPPAVPTGLTVASIITNAGASISASWNAVGDSDLAGYVIAIREAGGNYIEFTTTSASYGRTALTRGTVYTTKVLAFDKAGNRSGWSAEVTHTAARDNTAPALPVIVGVDPTFNSAFVRVSAPLDGDLALIVVTIFRQSDNVELTTVSVAAAPGSTVTAIVTNLPRSTPLYATASAIDTSTNNSGRTAGYSFTTAGGVDGADINVGSITSEKITINTLNGDRIQVGTLDADKITANTVLASSVRVGAAGTLQTVADRAADPAARINAHTTTIAPGRVTIQGTTTLDSWRDQTEIRGGAIKANSISVEKLNINARGISVLGLDFRFEGGRLHWTEGHVLYTDDAGNAAAPYIAAGSFGWAGGYNNYVLWDKGSNSFRQTIDSWEEAQNKNSNSVIMVVWRGASANFVVHYGGTIITGDRIVTNSIDASRLSVGSLSAISANIGLLRTASSGARQEIESNQTRVYDSNGIMRVRFGIW